jgi:hypothetical protein
MIVWHCKMKSDLAGKVEVPRSPISPMNQQQPTYLQQHLANTAQGDLCADMFSQQVVWSLPLLSLCQCVPLHKHGSRFT